VNYLPLTVGTNNEPAITNANNVKQLFLSVDVMSWPQSRSTVNFQTVIGTQDYTQAIATFGYLETASLQPCGTITQVAGSGTIATITCPNAFSVGANVTVTGLAHTGFNVTNVPILTATSTQFTFASGVSQAQVSDSGLAVSGQIFQIADVRNAEPLAESSDLQRPNAISVQSDDGAGNIKFRFMGVPNATFNCIVNFQQAATAFAALTDTWNPIPDRYAFIYNRLFLGETLEPVDAQRAQVEKQRGILSLVSIAQGMELEDKAIFVAQYLNIDAQTAANMLGTQQGSGAKAGR